MISAGDGISFDPVLMMEVFEFLLPDGGQRKLLPDHQEVFEVLPWRLDAARLVTMKKAFRSIAAQEADEALAAGAQGYSRAVSAVLLQAGA